MIKKAAFLFLLFLIIHTGFAQNCQKPNFALASHPMVIENTSVSSGHFIIELSIENKSTVGSFCANKDIFIRNLLNNDQLNLSYSEGIPVCPEAYRFKKIGEKLTFRLYFPIPKQTLKYIDLIENCNEACFSIRGIILDEAMNKQVDEAFNLFGKSKYQDAENLLLKIIDEYPDYPYGFLYLNLVQVLMIQDKTDQAKQYYELIKNAHFPDKQIILQQLDKTNLFSKQDQ